MTHCENGLCGICDDCCAEVPGPTPPRTQPKDLSAQVDSLIARVLGLEGKVRDLERAANRPACPPTVDGICTRCGRMPHACDCPAEGGVLIPPDQLVLTTRDVADQSALRAALEELRQKHLDLGRITTRQLDDKQATIEGLEAKLREVETERDELLSAARAVIPEAEYPKEATASNWAWQLRSLGEDRRACYRLLNEAREDLAKARAELERAKAVRP